MIRRPPRSTRTDTLFPYTTLFRSQGLRLGPNETIWAIALKLSAAPAIQKAIIGPGLRNHLMELHLPAPPVTPWASPFQRYTRSRRQMWREACHSFRPARRGCCNGRGVGAGGL